MENSLREMSSSLRNSSSTSDEERNVPVSVVSNVVATPNTNNNSNNNAPQHVTSSTFGLRLFLGQLLAICIALTGLFSSLLASKKSSIALLQSCTAYFMIFIFAAPFHYRNSSREHSEKIVHKLLLEQQQRESSSPSPQSNNNNNNNSAIPTSPEAENMNLIAAAISTNGDGILQVGIPGYFHAHFPVWRYFALGCCDVAASFFAIKAYSYTDITSAQLLDAATIFAVMILGYLFLRRRFNWRHALGLVCALGGMVGLVFLDATDRSRDSEKTAPDAVLGDILTLVASCLYGVTNVGCECLLKAGRVELPICCRCVAGSSNHNNSNRNQSENENQLPENNNDNNDNSAVRDETDQSDSDSENEQEQQEKHEGTTQHVRDSFHLIIEYVTYISLFGFFISFILLLALSLDEIKTASAVWDWKATMFQLAFCCVMVATYIGLPSLLKLTNATFTALSLLTADAYAVVLNYVTTGVAPKGLYYLCAAVILCGVLIFDTAETSKKKLKKSCGGLLCCG